MSGKFKNHWYQGFKFFLFTLIYFNFELKQVFFPKYFIYLVGGGKAEEENPQADSPLSAEPEAGLNAGLDLRTPRSQP